ncbi:MAG: ABC transporter ATP-binding protein [Candidatus Omnitrophica bacterium]|nr:ABC transporter ATP-binding protein [Candidatus Omnitrophota bacterium]
MINVSGLKKYYYKSRTFLGGGTDVVKAVDGVSFSVAKGETFGLVGESGSGKSTIAKLLTGIVKPDSGDINIGGDLDIVFQDPYSSLNPCMNVKNIIGESLYIRKVKKDEIEKRIKDILSLVRLEHSVLKKYPHQFSGGERQRIAIARAIVRFPAIVILDEPVSSLDVSIQAGILNLLKDLQDKMGLTYLFISHDLRVVEFMSDHIGVMKDGRLVEIAGSAEIYEDPKHEYTKHLLSSIPRL